MAVQRAWRQVGLADASTFTKGARSIRTVSARVKAPPVGSNRTWPSSDRTPRSERARGSGVAWTTTSDGCKRLTTRPRRADALDTEQALRRSMETPRRSVVGFAQGSGGRGWGIRARLCDRHVEGSASAPLRYDGMPGVDTPCASALESVSASMVGVVLGLWVALPGRAGGAWQRSRRGEEPPACDGARALPRLAWPQAGASWWRE